MIRKRLGCGFDLNLFSFVTCVLNDLGCGSKPRGKVALQHLFLLFTQGVTDNLWLRDRTCIMERASALTEAN